MSRRATHTRRWKFLQGLGNGMNGSESPLYYSTSNVVSQLYMKQQATFQLTSLSREPPTSCRCRGSWTPSWTRWAASGSRNTSCQIPGKRKSHRSWCFVSKNKNKESQKNLCIKVAVEGRVDILQDVAQLLQLPLHTSLQRKCRHLWKKH